MSPRARTALLVAAGGAAFAFLLHFMAPKLGLVSPLDAGRLLVGRRVLRRERARGVDARLQAFLDWWEQNGTFTIMVGVDGGVRTKGDQLRLYSKGLALQNGVWMVADRTQVVTNAVTNVTSAHGHAGALDLWPVLNGRIRFDIENPQVKEAYKALGEAAESFGLEWGGRWANRFGFGPHGDSPHIQVANWVALPVVDELRPVLV